MKLTNSLLAIGVAAIGTLIASCSTFRNAHHDADAPACTDCRIVVETDGNFEDYSNTPTPFTRHECSGCKSSVATLITEGRLEHRCSICKDSPYSCDVSHKTSPSESQRDRAEKTTFSGHTHVFKQR